jgi:hypothetical protein
MSWNDLQVLFWQPTQIQLRKCLNYPMNRNSDNLHSLELQERAIPCFPPIPHLKSQFTTCYYRCSRASSKRVWVALPRVSLEENSEDSTIAVTMMVAAVVVTVMTIPLDSVLPPPPIVTQDQISWGRGTTMKRGETHGKGKPYLLLFPFHRFLLSIALRKGKKSPRVACCCR